jgi:hypothetical protein
MPMTAPPVTTPDRSPRGAWREHSVSWVFRSRRTIALLVAFVGIAVAITAMTWRPVKSQLLLSTTRRPTPFTELSFDDVGTLPRTVRPGMTYALPFSITNRTGADTTYRVATEMRYDGRATSLATEQIPVAAGASIRRTVSFSPPDPNRTYEIVVALDNGELIRWRALAP